MAVVYSNNFDAETLGALPTGWVNKIGTWQVSTTTPVSGANTFGSNSNADGDMVLYTGATAIADMQIETKQIAVLNTGKYPMVGHVLRSDSANANSYVVLLSTVNGTNATIIIYKRVASVFTQLSTLTIALTVAAGNTLYLRSKIVGTTISAYLGNGSFPGAANFTVTDGSVTAAGYPGFYNGLDATTAAPKIDDFALDNLLGAVALANDAGIVYSPYNWDVTSARAKSINAGAYFKTTFIGSTCTLAFDMTNQLTPYPRLRIRVDGRTNQYTALAASISVTIPADQDNTTHVLQVDISATTETQNRWNAPQNTAVLLTGITLAGSTALVAPQKKPKTVLVFGDSITEGVRTLALNGTGDVDRNDSTVGWAYLLGEYLDAEVGVVGFGATGLSVTAGSGNVPKFSSTATSLWAATSRTFTVAPDYIVVNEGTNDGVTNTQADGIAAVNALLTAVSTSKIVLLRPFNGTNQASNLIAIQAGCSAPARVVYVDTAGYWNSADASDALHPYGWANVAYLASKVAAAVLAATFGVNRTVTLTLTSDGTTARASLTGLKWSFFDQVTPDIFAKPVSSGSGATTNATGVFSVSVRTSLAAGATGWIVITDSDGTTTQSPSEKAFAGPAVLS